MIESDRFVSLRQVCLTSMAIAKSPADEAFRSRGQWAEGGDPA